MNQDSCNIESIDGLKAAQIINDQIFDAEGRPAIDFDDYLENRSLGLILGSYKNLASILDNARAEDLQKFPLLDLDKKQFQKLLRDIQTHLHGAPKSKADNKAFIERLAKDMLAICTISSSPESSLEFSAICDDLSSFLSDLLTSKEVGFNEPTRQIGVSLENSLHEAHAPSLLLESYESLASALMQANTKRTA